MAKLTLHVPDKLVLAAKKEAASRRTSVSRLVSDYFRVFEAGAGGGGQTGLPPVTASLLGCIRKADSARETYIDYLERKHS